MTSAAQGPDQKFLAIVKEKPVTEARLTELLFEQDRAKQDAEAANDPENKIRHIPDIGPANPAYAEAKEHFINVLATMNSEKGRLIDVCREEFEDSQVLLLDPAIERSSRAIAQQENSALYQALLKTTFEGQADNTVTKMTMLRFGLPIAPLTKINALYAGTEKDKPAEFTAKYNTNASDDGSPNKETVFYTEKPLEFLDMYHKRHYGYPLIRTG